MHKVRNIVSKLPKKAYDSYLAQAKFIYSAESKKDAASKYRKWVAKYKNIP